MEHQTEGQKRAAAAYQWSLQASKLGFSVLARHPGYRFTVQDHDHNAIISVVVLACTWDFYEYRLHRSGKQVSMLVVQEHNAIAPLPVLELRTGNQYDPGAEPVRKRKQIKRRNHEETLLFVSKLLLGTDTAEQELLSMPARTRQRYLQRRNVYLKPRIGRPWAS